MHTAQCFGFRNHPPTEKAKTVAILRGIRLATQKCVFVLDDAKREREREQVRSPAQGRGSRCDTAAGAALALRHARTLAAAHLPAGTLAQGRRQGARSP